MLRPAGDTPVPHRTRMQWVLTCPTCHEQEGHEGEVRLGSVDVDQGTQRIIVDSGGVRTVPKQVGPEQGASTVTLHTDCAQGHTFRVLFEPKPNSPMLVTVDATASGTPPL